MKRPIVRKSEAGVFPVELVYSAPDLAAGESINSAQVTASPTGLTIGTPIINGDTVAVLLSGGTKGAKYIVYFEVTTSVGYTYNDPERDSLLVKMV